MSVLTDDAANDALQILELEGFTRWRDGSEVVVLVNPAVCKHPIPIRLNSLWTDELASRLLTRAGLSEERIDNFIKKHLRSRPRPEDSLPQEQL